MTHPTESDLALYAGGDLPWFRQWRVARHVTECGACQRAGAEYSELRTIRTAGPVVNWQTLSAEMKANIRLGLEAGECVGHAPAPRPIISGMRLAVAGGLLTVLVAVGAYVNRPVLRQISGTVLEASGSGIQVRGVQQTLRIMNPPSQKVMYTVGAQGELTARSVDPATGNVAITHVYGE